MKSLPYILVCLVIACQQPAVVPEPAPPAPLFIDVTTQAGLGTFRHETGARGDKWMPETYGAGLAFADYDRDGDPDLFLVAGARWAGDEGGGIPAIRLFANDGLGVFTEVTREAGLESVTAYGFGVSTPDYDNDGDPDVFLTTLQQNVLLQNNNGRYTDVTDQSGLDEHSEWSTASVFFDANRDGWLDVFVGNYVEWNPGIDLFCSVDGQTKDYCMPLQYEGVPSRFYLGSSEGRFAEVTHEAGFGDGPGKTLGAVTLDFDGDGWIDLAVANDTRRNLLFHNNGQGGFAEIGVTGGIAYDRNGKARAGMGIDAAFINESGHPAIAVGNFSDEMVGLFQYAGAVGFEDVAPRAGIGMPSLLTLTFGLLFFDADLDGDLDLLLANGHIMESVDGLQEGVTYRQPPQLFENKASGSFTEMPDVKLGDLRKPKVARGVATADIDQDGDQDLAFTENGGRVHIYANTAAGSKNWLRVALEGERSNRDATGSLLRAYLPNGMLVKRSLRAGGSYLSQSEHPVTLGLDTHLRVDSLHVHWPSGEVTRVGPVEAGETRYIRENENTQ